MTTRRASAEFRIGAFRAEAEALAAAAGTLSEADLARPSPCPPWTSGGLLCHVLVAAGRIDQAIAAGREGATARAGAAARDAGGPEGGLVDAGGYYRPDARFSPAVNADRIDLAADLAARLGTGPAIRAGLTAACARTLTALATAPPDLEVRTRHGDRMLLTEFLVTRVVELGVHGLDLAIGLDREPWLTAPAAEVIEDLLLPEQGLRDGLRDRLGCDQAGLIARLTGRVPLSPAGQSVLAGAGVTRLALG
jgi:uncharacterized protein (TIGR03083 family)